MHGKNVPDDGEAGVGQVYGAGEVFRVGSECGVEEVARDVLRVVLEAGVRWEGRK